MKRIFMVVIKKENILSVLFLTLGFAAFLWGVILNPDMNIAMEALSPKISEKVIIIDPGHGGIDGGAMANELKEKDINLDIALKLRDIAERGGARVYLTRSADVSTEDKNRSKNITQKKSDLTERKKLIEKYNADMFISIHMNKFSEEKYKGAQVFYNENSEDSKAFAECLQNALKKYLDGENKRLAKADGGIYVLKGNRALSVLIECGFLSNKEEAENFKCEEYRQKVAEAIYKGICEFSAACE